MLEQWSVRALRNADRELRIAADCRDNAQCRILSRAKRALECGGLTPLLNSTRPTKEKRIRADSLKFLDRLDDGVEVRPVSGVELGMEQFAIGANLESAAARGNEGERLDALAELKNFGRQTDGFRRVVSDDAVFDRYLGFHQRAPFRERKYRRG
jgi:hypothetical protein